MKYSVFLLSRAVRQVELLEVSIRNRLQEWILKLQENPRPANSKKLAGREGWRLRIGNYRVLYEVDDKAKSVTILDVGHRKDIYRRQDLLFCFALTLASSAPRAKRIETSSPMATESADRKTFPEESDTMA